MSAEIVLKITKEKDGISMANYVYIAENIGRLVEKKNAAYGDAYGKSGEFLKLLYPDGVKPEQYKDMLAIIRVFDKLMRVANKKEAFGENPWEDIAGYAILMCQEGRN